MGWLAALGGAAGGAAGGLFGFGSSAQSYGYNKALQRRAYKFARRYRQNMYQDITSSLEAAGLNPLLAFGGFGGSGGSLGGSPSMSPAHVGADLVSSAKGGMLMKEAFKQAKAETERKRSEAKREGHEAGIAGVREQYAEQEVVATINSLLASAEHSRSSAVQAGAQTELLELQAKIRAGDVPRAELKRMYHNTWIGKALNAMGITFESILPILSRIKVGGR